MTSEFSYSEHQIPIYILFNEAPCLFVQIRGMPLESRIYLNPVVRLVLIELMYRNCTSLV